MFINLLMLNLLSIRIIMELSLLCFIIIIVIGPAVCDRGHRVPFFLLADVLDYLVVHLFDTIYFIYMGLYFV